MTEDYGNSWQSLASKDIDGFIHVMEQDHKNENLLFLGTEFGLYFSLDKGKEWIKWTSGFPTVPVPDLAVHPRENDLVIGTHGRSIYILDDISFLREISAALLEKEAYLFPVKDTSRYIQYSRISSYSTLGDTGFMGPNPSDGAELTFYFNPKEELNTAGSDKKNNKPAGNHRESDNPPSESIEKKKLAIEISDQDGKVVKKLDTTPRKGINRISWDLREGKFDSADLPADYFALVSLHIDDVYVFPGAYTAKLTYGDLEMKAGFQVKPDPRFPPDPAVLKKNMDLAYEMQSWFKALAESLEEIKNTREKIATVKEMAEAADFKNKDELLKKGGELDKKLKSLSEKIEMNPEQQGFPDIDTFLSFKFYEVYDLVAGSVEPLNQSVRVRSREIKDRVEAYLKEYNTLFETGVADFKKSVTESGLALFKEFKPLNRQRIKKWSRENTPAIRT